MRFNSFSIHPGGRVTGNFDQERIGIFLADGGEMFPGPVDRITDPDVVFIQSPALDDPGRVAEELSSLGVHLLPDREDLDGIDTPGITGRSETTARPSSFKYGRWRMTSAGSKPMMRSAQPGPMSGE